MELKRAVIAAAVATGISISGASFLAAPAVADPPPGCNQPNCQGGGPQWQGRGPHPGDAGWNDGPAPGGPPAGYNGPPPPGGWNGAPPPGGWNRRWEGPPRNIDQARFDHQPFNYSGFNAVPTFDASMGGWGFWYFGTWIAL
jgi:hypothetical protein